MIGRAVSVLLLTAACLQSAMAQPADNGLDAAQKQGRQLLAQSCGVCHLPPALGARTYGPQLSRETAGGNDDVMARRACRVSSTISAAPRSTPSFESSQHRFFVRLRRVLVPRGRCHLCVHKTSAPRRAA